MVESRTNRADTVVERLDVSVFKVPTDEPESDGTLEWDSTTLVTVEAHGGGKVGLGYTYADPATGRLIQDKLAGVVAGTNAMAVSRNWRAMIHSVRNLGLAGIAAMGISAVDSALWDLKARLLDLPLATLLGAAHRSVPVYGSGGFTSYAVKELQTQLGGWAAQGIPRVKMKIGRDSQADIERVRAARKAIGPDTQLFVDANGAYSRKQALAQSERFTGDGVVWFEEPVSSDDLRGLHLIRNRVPAGMQIAAGEYGYEWLYFRRMLEAGAVDVLQADATRCLGISGFLMAGTLAQSFSVPLSAHCAPSLHLHPCCAVGPIQNLEYFHDHVRIEHLLFDGAASPVEGALHPDLSRSGLGLELKRADAQRFAV